MKKLKKMQAGIERIHQASIDALNRNDLKPQLRRELSRIAEESLELCRLINSEMAKSNPKGDGLLKSIWAFLSSAASFFSRLDDDED